MDENIARDNFKAIVSAYRKATGHSLVTTSKQLYGNAEFLENFFAGRSSVSIRKMHEMMVYLRENWPDGAAWPHTRAIFFHGPARSKRKISPTSSAAA